MNERVKGVTHEQISLIFISIFNEITSAQECSEFVPVPKIRVFLTQSVYL